MARNLVPLGALLSKRRGTRNTYSSHGNLYEHFCKVLVISPRQPISEEDLCACCWLFCHSRSFQSMAGWLSGVEHYCKSSGLPPLPRGEMFKEHRKGLHNLFGQIDTVQPSAPVTLEDLRLLRQSLNLNDKEQARFWFVTVLAWQALLRAGEFTAGRMLWGDLEWHEWGLRITVPFSKTRITKVHVDVVRRDDWLCPVAAANNLRRLTSPWSSTPIFPRSYNAFNTEFKARFKAAGVIKQSKFSSHGLRRGGATALFDAGVPEPTIMAHGRWLSMAWRRYIDFEAVLHLASTKMLLKHHRSSISV
jgi:integrase